MTARRDGAGAWAEEVAAVLASLGVAPTTAADGGVALGGAAGCDGRARAGAALGRVCFAPVLPSDPVAQARLGGGLPAPLRLVRRHDRTTVEGRGARDRVVAALLALRGADPATVATPLVLDLVVGVLAVTVPPLAVPTFLRLAREDQDPPIVDRARGVFVLVANADLAVARAAWSGGPGLLVEPAAAANPALADEIRAMHDGIGALADPVIAASYLERTGSSPAPDSPAAEPVPTPNAKEDTP